MNETTLRKALARYWLVLALVVLGAVLVYEARRSAPPPAPAPLAAAPAGVAPAAAGGAPASSASAGEMAAVKTFLPPAGASYHVDVATFAGKQLVFSGTMQPEFSLPAGSGVSFRGWAVDAKNKALSRGVALLVDGRTRVAGSLGGARPDVAAALGSAALTNAGFDVALPPAVLPRGRHTASLLVLDAPARAFYEVKDVIRIDVR